MKKVLIFALALAGYCASQAQNIIDAEEGRNYNDFYQRIIVEGKKATPYPSLRQSDVIWEMVVWRDINLDETFNQFFYFPQDETKDNQGRINLLNLLMGGLERGDIVAFEDDDLKKEMTFEEITKQLEGEGRSRIEEVVDENGDPVEDENGDIVTRRVQEPGVFERDKVKRLRIKERWYIDKQDCRQKVRIVGLEFQYQTPDKLNDEGELLFAGGMVWSPCIPMDDMRTRQLLVNANVYDPNNDVRERSYDDIFIQRYFNSYVVRESNVYNRSIADYLTGEDAMLESNRIEDKIYNIESDMWEY